MKRSIEQQAQDHTERAIAVLAEIIDDPFEESKDRIKAADSLLDRGHGKPIAVSLALPGSRRAAELANYTDEELIAAIEQQPLPRLAALPDSRSRIPSLPDVIDAEFVPAGHNSGAAKSETVPTDDELLA